MGTPSVRRCGRSPAILVAAVLSAVLPVVNLHAVLAPVIGLRIARVPVAVAAFALKAQLDMVDAIVQRAVFASGQPVAAVGPESLLQLVNVPLQACSLMPGKPAAAVDATCFSK